MRAVIVIPTYNEAENIRSLTTQVLEQEGVNIVVIVDDNSPDGTGEIADEIHCLQPKRVKVIHRTGKLGLGTAYVAGFHRAFELGADRIITMDADFSHKPDYIPDLLAASKTYQLVIGSRYVPQGGTLNWGIHRHVLSRGANVVARTALGLAARDCTSGFRCYQAELLHRIALDQIRSNGYSFLIEILYLCERVGATAGEVPIIFEDRQFGASKISQVEILRAWQTVYRLTRRRLSARLDLRGKQVR